MYLVKLKTINAKQTIPYENKVSLIFENRFQFSFPKMIRRLITHEIKFLIRHKNADLQKQMLARKKY